MGQGTTRVFTVDGIQYSFNSKAFLSLVDRCAKEKCVSKGQIAEELREQLCVTVDAVYNWKYGRNGPANMEMIERIAEYFHVDWKLLMKSTRGGNTVAQLTERQKDAVKRIYDMLIWFLEEFSNTDGFSSWWLELKEQGSQTPEDDIFERITQMEERVGLVLEQEYFDLHDHEIYNMLCEFIGEDLKAVYSGKVGEACRAEADGESAPAVWREYEIARQRLNEIIERYI